ncbi:adenylosuccinate synthase [Desulfovibrio inopinatus]|uniref:adenylosuccinate synthase n=1 Tax=Desulfovibrio inopinatus TaxID=102109 RepID=UPI0003F70806|nr:adenylosuccinate synthase [Desulfovibrio inopinatus]
MSGQSIVIHGAQWGDEGKGKIVDLMTEKADVITRFQGGNNAGHTLVVNDEKTILHLIPSGILHPGKVCLIGNGVVLDPVVFCQELDKLEARGVDVSPQRIRISRKTQVIMPYHRRLDAAREAAKEGGRIGTTGRGIGPCYEDKMSRIGIRACDFADVELLKIKIEAALAEKNVLFTSLYSAPAMTVETVFEEIKDAAARLVPYLTDVDEILDTSRKQGKTILFEGAQGTMLDIDHGTYPFVTSSNTVSGNAAAGSGFTPRGLTEIIAVVKAYTTRVGAGPFPTELECESGNHMQSVGAEFGATTGRKRRCGWLDICVLRQAVRLNGPTGIALTKLDVLGGLKELQICTAYETDGKTVDYPPQQENGLAHVSPVYETMPGWAEDISGAKSWDDLPQAARNYIERIEALLETPVTIISVGPGREQTIIR